MTQEDNICYTILEVNKSRIDNPEKTHTSIKTTLNIDYGFLYKNENLIYQIQMSERDHVSTFSRELLLEPIFENTKQLKYLKSGDKIKQIDIPTNRNKFNKDNILMTQKVLVDIANHEEVNIGGFYKNSIRIAKDMLINNFKDYFDKKYMDSTLVNIDYLSDGFIAYLSQEKEEINRQFLSFLEVMPKNLYTQQYEKIDNFIIKQQYDLLDREISNKEVSSKSNKIKI